MKKTTLLKVVKSGVLFLIVFFVADRGIGLFLKNIYFKQTRGDFYQTTYGVKNAKEDVLIFGSSRAMHHYISDVFEKKLSMSTFNIGRNGRNLLYSHALFSQILTYTTPKVVILDLSPIEFSKSESTQGEDTMISSLLPYHETPAINESISRIRKKDLILSKIFKTYPYNSSAIQMLGYYYGFKSEIKNLKGYVPLKGSKIAGKQKNTKVKANEVEKDKNLMAVLEDFLKKAKAKGVKVYVFVSPTTIYASNNSIEDIKRITTSFGYNFHDCTHMKDFNDYSLFYDITHLNHTGALKYSDFVVSEIKKDSSLTNFENNISTSIPSHKLITSSYNSGN